MIMDDPEEQQTDEEEEMIRVPELKEPKPLNIDFSPPETRNKRRQRCEEEKKELRRMKRKCMACGDMPEDFIYGASYLRYEIIERRGEKIVVPVRYSIR